MLKLELLPAREGDCLVLSWGKKDTPRRILIDAGRTGTAEDVRTYIQANNLQPGAFERFIITHIDRDHIEGAVNLLRDPDFKPLIGQVWFNGRDNISTAGASTEYENYGALDGERVTTALTENGYDWNTDFDGGPIIVGDELPTVELEGGMKLTILSPDLRQLGDMAKPWDEALDTAPPGWENLGPSDPINIETLALTPFKGDRAKPNGSSIAMVAEYRGDRILLTGDAHVPRLLESLALYQAQFPEKKSFSLVKASHHGSRGNVSTELVEAVDCKHWAISTSGAQFRHPDQEAIARIIMHSPRGTTVWFNYDQPQTKTWRRPTKPDRGFKPEYGNGGLLAIDIA
jgi:beta-lactamase superfamily II metal-dependent hydrolase